MTVLKRVLVTGAEGILGGAVARRFRASGCEVIGTCFGAPPAGDHAWQWLRLDAADPQAVQSVLPQIASVDAWVHCAGGFRWAKADEISDDAIEFLLGSNLKSALYLARALLPGMKKRGFGRIVFVSSKATLQGAGAGLGAYAASKAGINQIVSALADETRSYDINVNAVLPSVIDTPANRKDMGDADAAKWVKPEALAEVIYSLTQPAMQPVHGALIPVAGRV